MNREKNACWKLSLSIFILSFINLFSEAYTMIKQNMSRRSLMEAATEIFKVSSFEWNKMLFPSKKEFKTRVRKRTHGLRNENNLTKQR